MNFLLRKNPFQETKPIKWHIFRVFPGDRNSFVCQKSFPLFSPSTSRVRTPKTRKNFFLSSSRRKKGKLSWQHAMSGEGGGLQTPGEQSKRRPIRSISNSCGFVLIFFVKQEREKNAEKEEDFFLSIVLGGSRNWFVWKVVGSMFFGPLPSRGRGWRKIVCTCALKRKKWFESAPREEISLCSRVALMVMYGLASYSRYFCSFFHLVGQFGEQFLVAG